jgi:hypothetical protein
MRYTLFATFFVVALFGAILLLLEIGRRIAVRRMATDPEGAKAGLGAVVGIVFSLLGLLLAFTFSGAASRFDARRQLAVQEVNTLDKAYYLVELYPEPLQTQFKESIIGAKTYAKPEPHFRSQRKRTELPTTWCMCSRMMASRRSRRLRLEELAALGQQ